LEDDIIDSKEPLVLSLLNSVFEDLKSMHTHLKVLDERELTSEVKRSYDYFKDTEHIKKKLATQTGFIDQIESYIKEIN